MASVSWTSTTSGSWNTPDNWSTGANPLAGDDVTISTPGDSITVTYSTGSLALDSLTTGSSDSFSLTGGALSTSSGYSIDGSLLLSGGTMRLAGGYYGDSFENSLSMSGGSLFLTNNAQAYGGVLTQTAGTITIAHGAFTDSENSGSLAGTITGGGEIVFSGGGTTLLQSGFTLSTGAADIASGTVFLLENLSYGHNFSLTGTLDLNGHTATLSGNVGLDGDVNGGSLTVSGSGHLNNLLLDNGALLAIGKGQNRTSLNQTGNIQIGGNSGTGTLDISAAGTLRITGNDTIYQGSSSGSLINSGLLEKTAGNSEAGASYIETSINSTGIVDAAVGTIDFRGSDSTITGTLEGAGTIAFDSGSYVLGGGAGLVLTSHRLAFGGNTSSTNITIASALSYGGLWQQTGALLLFENNLTLTGSSTTALDGGEFKGTATITDSGALQLGAGMDLEGNLTFLLNGNVDQTGAINLGALSDSVDQATLAAGTTWSLEGASSISGAYGTITNNGTLVRLDGAQNAVVSSDLISTGSVLVDTGTLSLSGQGTLGGTVAGASVLDISGQFTMEAGLALSVGELILDNPAQSNDIQASLAGNLTYGHVFAQEGGTLALNGYTLTVSGVTTLDSGAILGPGEVMVTGPATILNVAVAQGAILQFDGTTEQSGNVTLTGGSTAPTLSIGAGAVYNLDNGVTIGGAGGSVVGTVTVSGTLVAAGAGNTIIAATIKDTGSIQISHGQMAFMGPLTGAGAVTISAGGILDLDNAATTTTGITFGGGGGLLYLQDPAAFGGAIGGFNSGDAVELNGFAFVGASIQSVSGDKVTIAETSGPSATLTFTTAQNAANLMLGVGPHGGLALIHS
jgi:fibronectin-binding autotransporter adhesin